MLGIIGGMGPHAGKNLFDCILNHSNASKDQDHLPVVLWSTPHKIADRSEFLLGKTDINPAVQVAEIARQMQAVGVEIIGIPCNTFHAKPIWEVLLKTVQSHKEYNLKILNMINLTVGYIAKVYPETIVGILGTMGTYQYNVYGDALSERQINFVMPNENDQIKVHQSVYDARFGIKSTGIITAESLQIVHEQIKQLSQQGAAVILLGCTELSLIPIDNLPKENIFVDPVDILAKAMIEAYQ